MHRRLSFLFVFCIILSLCESSSSVNSAAKVRLKFSIENEDCEINGALLSSNNIKRDFTYLKSVELKCGAALNAISSDENFLVIIDCANGPSVRETSVFEQIQRAFIWGASAVIILAINGDYFSKLNLNRALTRPVIFVSTNITKILMALARSATFTISPISAKESISIESTLTAWGMCGRMSTMGFLPWDGTVCVGQSEDSKSNPHTFWTFYYAILLLFCLLMLIKSRANAEDLNGDDMSNSAIIGKQLAARALKSMRCYKCKHVKLESRSDLCAICLDGYYLKQLVRILPCGHQFHSFCVDGWLMENFTCPLCKLNTVDWLLEKSKM